MILHLLSVSLKCKRRNRSDPRNLYMIKFPYVENSDNSSTQLSVPVTVKHNKSYKESITTNTSFIYYVMLSVINLKHCYSLRIN